ncbi:MAG: hypothetical protein ACO1OB_30995 [Archangium sp.]
MTENELLVDEVAARIYRAAPLVGDEALRELLKNAAVKLLSADTPSLLRNTLQLVDGLLVLAALRGVLDEEVATALRAHGIDFAIEELALQ